MPKLPKLPSPPTPELKPPPLEDGPAGALRVLKGGIRRGKRAIREARKQVTDLADEFKGG